MSILGAQTKPGSCLFSLLPSPLHFTPVPSHRSPFDPVALKTGGLRMTAALPISPPYKYPRRPQQPTPLNLLSLVHLKIHRLVTE